MELCECWILTIVDSTGRGILAVKEYTTEPDATEIQARLTEWPSIINNLTAKVEKRYKLV